MLFTSTCMAILKLCLLLLPTEKLPPLYTLDLTGLTIVFCENNDKPSRANRVGKKRIPAIVIRPLYLALFVISKLSAGISTLVVSLVTLKINKSSGLPL